MKKAVFLLLWFFAMISTAGVGQTKEECVKYIKSRFQSRFDNEPISVRLIGSRLIIKTPSLGNHVHVSEYDMKYLDDVDLFLDDELNNYQLKLLFAKEVFREYIETQDGKKTTDNFSPKSVAVILGYDKDNKAEGEKMGRVVKKLAKHCGAKVLDIE